MGLIYNARTPMAHIKYEPKKLVGGFIEDMLSRQNYDKLSRYVRKTVKPQHYATTLKTLWDIRKHSCHMAMKFTQISASADTSIEAWLEKTTYTRKEKDDFLKIEKLDTLKIDKKDKKCKCFVKAETYPEYKHFRPIKSRTDKFKARVGPIFQLINEQLFSNLEWFIKKIPVKERPEFLKKKFGDNEKKNCTDFSSFEAHFVAMIMFAIEWPLYCWLTRNINNIDFLSDIEVLLEKNRCEFKDFMLWVSSRASGEMNTSSGNGWCNLVLYTYTARAKGAVELCAMFEGDDSINKTRPPSSSPTTEDFRDLGWICKLENVDKFEEASFCGLVADIDDLINICDIRAYIADFGWTRQQYLNASDLTKTALLRAKGYSAIYQYPGCPIIQDLGYYALRVTSSTKTLKKFDDMLAAHKFGDSRYKAGNFEALYNKYGGKIPERVETPQSTRRLVERLQKITLEQQIEIENYIRGLESITCLSINLDFPVVWKYNWDRYISDKSFDSNEHRQIQRFETFASNYAREHFTIEW